MSRAPLVFSDPEVPQSVPVQPSLSSFKPRGAGQGAPAPAMREAIDQATEYPSREAPDPIAVPQAIAVQPVEGQLNIRAPLEIIDRFRRLCGEDRRTYAEMLRILMDERPTHQADRARPTPQRDS